MKHTLLASALVALLISYVAAQDSERLPQASAHVRTPPSYCKPCLFYAGDWDSDASDANGLSNEKDIVVGTGAAVYTPFIVPKGKTWTITGLFTDNFMSSMTLDPKVIPYEVRKGIPKAGGSGGQLVCHGSKPGTLIFTQGGYGYSIWATKVENIRGCRLPAGKYWMTVVPYCTNVRDEDCIGHSVQHGYYEYRAYLSNDDGAMANRYGPLEPANDSFFNSEYYGANWDPTSKWQTSSRFSVGVEGTAK